ncbi:hypothetical protein BTHE68_40130 [Burkholderia sp. THE68]|uniref:hypothetical protein n=1 Tax=Burkholderia sp. THE68 TaxID=758782 RepID=UPI001317A333|nr:hypothetical protein [Burkholderia sp. THE68]BBU30279.1 hypothetical protein BTHE68_40130 [Burkholderia sp. THE68]
MKQEPKNAPEESDGGGSFTWPWRVTITSAKASTQTDPIIPWPLAEEAFPPSVKNIPVFLQDLIGRQCRMLTPSSVVAEEFRHDRVNILVDDSGIITDIRFF